MKSIFTLLFVLIFSLTSWGQTYFLKGQLLDSNDKNPLPGAHVLLKNHQSNGQETTVTNTRGVFQFSGLSKGGYTLEISFIGFQSFQKDIQINNQDINLGKIDLKEGVELEAVELTEQVAPVIQKGDTTEFDSKAYKTLPDADAEDLISKMPTVVVEDGKVQAQGEDVAQVLVDGKQFFGNDPTAALRNLPAEVIDKIQVFDQQSEQAQFTGFNDGETTKTINIVTKPNMRNGQFGKIYGGYGTDDRYQVGGNINIFNGDQRTSIIGMSNNINIQNFSTEDLLGVVGSSGRGRGRGRRGGGRGGRGGGRGGGGTSTSDFLVSQQNGISNTNAFGINFSDKWGDKVDLAASYFFNHSENVTDQFLNQQFFDDEGIDERYTEESISESKNVNHRLTARITYQIDSSNSLIFRPRLSWQGNNGVETVLGQNIFGSDLISQSANYFQANLSTLSFNNSLLWRHKFEKTRRTLSVNLSTGYAPKSGESFLQSDNLSGSGIPDSLSLDQFSELDINSWNVSSNFQFTEPVGRRAMLLLNYRFSYQREESDRETFDFNSDVQQYDLFNEQLSNVFSNDYYTQQLGGGYNYRKRGLSFMARANVQWAQLLNEQVFPELFDSDRTFWNVLPMLSFRYRVDRSENLNIVYRTNTQLPSIEQLQNVLDNSNPLQLELGNPTLGQSFSHTLFMRYTKTYTEKSSVFFAMLRGSYTQDYIASSTYLSADEETQFAEFNPLEGAQLTLPENLDGYWNLRTFITYGFPVKFIKSNLNLDFTANYVRTPGLINEEMNLSNNTTAGIGITIGSNISDRVDFRISSRSNYNIATNTLQSESETTYFNQRTRFKLDWILPGGIVFRSDITHQYYDGLSQDLDQNFWLWNMSVGKKLFKRERGEISVSVFDLLKQNTNLNRTVTETYIEDVQNNVLQQYFLVSFKYDLRHFRVKR